MASNNNNNDNPNPRAWEFPFSSSSSSSARTTGRGVDHSNTRPFWPPPPSHPFPPGHAPRPSSQQPSSPFGPAAAWASWMAGGENSPWWVFSPPEPEAGRHRRGGRGGDFGRQRGEGPSRRHDAAAAASSSASSSDRSATATAGSDKTKNKEKSRDEGFTDLMDDSDSNFPDPAEVTPTEDDEEEPIRRPSTPRRRRGGGAAGRHHRPPFCRRAGPHPPPHPHHAAGINKLWEMFNNNPVLKSAAEHFAPSTSSPDTDFTPPVDIFRHERSYVVHVALPGARKADVGVDWDPQRACLRIAGVVHRPGDEEFLNSLVVSERRVGVFDRSVSLPPYSEGAATGVEIDAAAITAKMEHGILIVNVPLKDEAEPNVQRVKID
ncbi:hypothetical protein CP533_2284 [Ophiocordyceps camponoti-saundersi (nom. inval.)]|nr:hypothetical protein CP533_2284 [Ophiocordyceps camponoti-saundersi (nom. inval.)]